MDEESVELTADETRTFRVRQDHIQQGVQFGLPGVHSGLPLDHRVGEEVRELFVCSGMVRWKEDGLRKHRCATILDHEGPAGQYTGRSLYIGLGVATALT